MDSQDTCVPAFDIFTDTLGGKLVKRLGGDPPFLSWCLIVRNAEKTLEATLKSLRERTPDAEIVIVHTGGSKDRTEEISLRYADVYEVWKGPRGDWDDEMFAFDDAAAARQRSFELASGKWRAWVDADDRLPDAVEVERLLKLNDRYQPSVGGKVAEVDAEPVKLIDLLQRMEAQYPEIDCVWAPYLYQRDKNDHAMVWQERERIVKWETGWRWAEAAHEILVPVGHNMNRASFTSLLFLHEKDWTLDDKMYSMERHYKIFIEQYEKGEITSRRCHYLAQYAMLKCPERRLEFVNAAYSTATTLQDKYRALVLKGQYYTEIGLLTEAQEAFGSAVMLVPHLPDAYVYLAQSYQKFGVYERACHYFEQALERGVGVESEINPRNMRVQLPTMLSDLYVKRGKMLLDANHVELAWSSFKRARHWSEQVVKAGSVGADASEAEDRLKRVINLVNSMEQANNIASLVEYLIKNDEPVKALDVLNSRPWNLEDHPQMLACEKALATVSEHAEGIGYEEFYNDDKTTGFVPSHASMLETNYAPARAKWVAAWLLANHPNARVLEIGCADGNIAIPVMNSCPGITYVGVDMNHGALKTFRERMEKNGMSRARAMCVHDDKFSLDRLDGYVGKFDVILMLEIIEHVPSPSDFIDKYVKDLLEPGGTMLMSTPWGSFDHGVPPATNIYESPRDPRGHLRAYTLQAILDDIDRSVMECTFARKHLDFDSGENQDGMFLVLKKRKGETSKRTAIVAPASLWNWNGSKVEREGIGASEEMMINLSEHLGQGSSIHLGSLEEEEVHNGVRYLSIPKLRRLGENDTMIVSRYPQWGAEYKTRARKILWLQDTIYPDLTAKVADAYETIVVVSEWHKRLTLEHLKGEVHEEKIKVIHNWVQPEHFTPFVAKKLDHFIYASSPDRGLLQLLRMWPKIREALPEATLAIFYGWKGCEQLGFSSAQWSQRYEPMRREYEKLRYQPGIEFHGMVSHREIAMQFKRAGVWAYPTDFHETCCTNAIKARAAGAIPVCPPLAALEETAKSAITKWTSLKLDENEFVDRCVDATLIQAPQREAMSQQALLDHSTDAAIALWSEVLK